MKKPDTDFTPLRTLPSSPPVDGPLPRLLRHQPWDDVAVAVPSATVRLVTLIGVVITATRMDGRS